jgi:hypothetical protein
MEARNRPEEARLGPEQDIVAPCNTQRAHAKKRASLILARLQEATKVAFSAAQPGQFSAFRAFSAKHV